MSDSIDIGSLRKRLNAAGQGHVLRFWDELDTAQRSRLAAQLESIDLDQLQRLVAGEDENRQWHQELFGWQYRPVRSRQTD